MKYTVTYLLAAVLGLAFLTGLAGNNTGREANYQRFEFPFFSSPVAITYDVDMRLADFSHIDNETLRQSLRTLRRKPTHALLNSLLQAKQEYELNDFLFYKMARNATQIIYEGSSRNAQELTLYQLLLDAGFDARLTYRGNKVYVNVHTEEDLFEVPIIDVRGKPYANVSCMGGDCSGRQRLFIYDEQPNPRGRSFGFQLNRWPSLAVQPEEKQLRFQYHGVPQDLTVTFDRTMVDIMRDYPFIHEYCYLETPLSATLSESLLPQLRAYMKGLDQQQQLELLASFTRSAFQYKEDNEYFGRSKPMVPEELFGYSYSDCEDRSALFFALVRDLMDLPMAVIAYDDHLTVAVGSETLPGDSFRYEGRRYVFADPTGPRNSSRIGQIPPGYEDKYFSVIGSYN